MDVHLHVLPTAGTALSLVFMGPVYAELDNASLREAEETLEKARKHSGDPYFLHTKLVAQLGRVKLLLGKPERAKKILESLENETRLLPANIGKILIHTNYSS